MFNDNQLINVVVAIQFLTKLTKLCFKNNILTNNIAKRLSYSLQYLNSLERLNLEGCKVSLEGMYFVCQTIKKMLILKSMNLNKNCLNSNEFLLRSIENLTLLEKLSMSNVGLGDEGVKIISTFIKKLKCLQLLDISHNEITDIGISDICDQFPFMIDLKELNISINRITECGASKLAETLNYLPNLTHFYINNNNIQDSGAISLSEVIPKLDKLLYLFLD